MNYSSWGWDAKPIVIGGGRNLSVCQRMDESGLLAVRYKVFGNRNCNNVKYDLDQLD